MLNPIGFYHLEFAFLQAKGKSHMQNAVALLNLLDQSARVLGELGSFINVTVNIIEEAIRITAHEGLGWVNVWIIYEL
jgi:hypothetical protein